MDAPSVGSTTSADGGEVVAANPALINLPEDVQERLSPMARLGYKAHAAVASGESLDDERVVEIFVEEIRQLPEGNCWIMDNFPTTIEQAKVNKCIKKPFPAFSPKLFLR